MPVYDYTCPTCGPFNTLATVDQAWDDAVCPKCLGEAPRDIRTMPNQGLLDVGTRTSLARNEKAREVPFSKEGWGEEKARRAHDARKGHRHGPGCGCGGEETPTRTVVRPDGSKYFPGARPWMISH
ncbi:FmdB family zinc ribbon protein [Rhodospirillum sp. A1_3_36]|uniref:FmdB family zinc ribbon protein n=1 Tax=Rhodospirillum sp. A1_3_36 TaxID=3391666 RepID=UPI0039A6B00E